MTDRQTGGVGANVDLLNTGANQHETGGVGASVDLHNIGQNTRETGGVGASVDLRNTAQTTRETGGVSASVDLHNIGQNTRETGGVAAQADIRNTGPNTRETGGIGAMVDLSLQPTIRETGSVGVNVDLANTGVVEYRETGAVGVNADLANTGIVTNREIGAVGVNVGLANTGVVCNREVGSVGVNVDLAAVAIVLNRETGGLVAQVDFQNTGPAGRQTGGVGAQVDFQPPPNINQRQTGGLGVQVDFAAPTGAAGRETAWLGAQVDLNPVIVANRETGWVGAQVDLNRSAIVAMRRAAWIAAQVDLNRSAVVASRRTGALGTQIDLRFIIPRTVPANAYMALRRQRAVPANVALSGTGNAVLGFTGRVGTGQSLPGRLEPGNPSAGFMPPPQATRAVPMSAAFRARYAHAVPARIALGGAGPTSALGLPWSSLTQYERVGLLAGPFTRTVPINVNLSSISVLRTTQAAVEVLAQSSPNVRTTQAAVEALTQSIVNLRTTQAAVEVLTRIILTLSRSVPISATFKVVGARTVPFRAAFALPSGYVASFVVFTENTSDLGIRPSRLGAGFVLGVSAGVGPSRTERVVPVQAALQYTTTHALVTQAALDVLVKAASARITQAAIEALIQAASARVTQAAVEAVHQGNSARVTQAAIEILWPRTAPRQVPATAALGATRQRVVPASVLFDYQFARAVPMSMALRATYDRPVHAIVNFLSHNTRVVPINLTTTWRFTRTVPFSGFFLGGANRTVPFRAAVSRTQSRTVPVRAQFTLSVSYIVVNQPPDNALWRGPSFPVSGISNGNPTDVVHFQLHNLTTGFDGGSGSTASVNADGTWSGTQYLPIDLYRAGDRVQLVFELRDGGLNVLASTTLNGSIGQTYDRTVPISADFTTATPHVNRTVQIRAVFAKRNQILLTNVAASLVSRTRSVPFSASFSVLFRTVPISAEFFLRESIIHRPQAVLRYSGFAIPASAELSSPTNIIKPVQAVISEPEPSEQRMGDYVWYPGGGGVGGVAGGVYGGGTYVPPSQWGYYYWPGVPPRIYCNTIITPTVFTYNFQWIAWGQNTFNQLAYTGSNTVVPNPVNTQARRRYHRVYPGVEFALGMSQGRLYHWGTNQWGQRSDNIVVDGFLQPRTVFTYADPPPPQGDPNGYTALPPIQQAGAGQGHCVALDVNGNVWTWGRSDMNQTGLGSYGDPDVLYWDCAYHDGTRIYCQPYAKQVAPGSIPLARFVTCGEHFTLILGQDNTLWYAGIIGSYPAPDPTQSPNLPPYTPDVLKGWTQINHGIGQRIQRVRGGRKHAVLVTVNGQLWTWGANEHGQLGTGTTGDRAIPTYITDGVLDAAPFGDSTMVLFNDGHVEVCGDNSDGQCGQEIFNDHFSNLSPVATPPVEAISYGGGFARTAMVVTQRSSDPSIADAESEVWGWGFNGYYQLLDGGTDSNPVPQKLGAQRGITQIALSDDGVHASDDDFKDEAMTLEHWRTWGEWDTGALGAGRVFNPYFVPNPDDPQDWRNWNIQHTEPGPLMLAHSEKFAGFYVVRGRTDGAMAMDRLGRVHNWGKDDQGQLGTGAESYIYSPNWYIGAWTPLPVPNVETGWMGWAWGNQNFIRIFEGNLMAWGDNRYYQLGLGHNQGDAWLGNNNITIPTSVPSLYGADVAKMIGTSSLSIALLYDGRLMVAGTDSMGLVGVPGLVYPEFVVLGSGG